MLNLGACLGDATSKKILGIVVMLHVCTQVS